MIDNTFTNLIESINKYNKDNIKIQLILISSFTLLRNDLYMIRIEYKNNETDLIEWKDIFYYLKNELNLLMKYLENNNIEYKLI